MTVNADRPPERASEGRGPSAPVSLRDVRLAAGLVMFAFVTTHLLNHALGIVSLHAMAMVREWFTAFWRSPPVTVLLYGAVLVHVGLALTALYRRRTLRMPLGEFLQLALGLSIPLLLITHVMGTRVRSALSGFEDRYDVIVQLLWVDVPSNGLRQILALLVVWTHGCIGLYFWLRPRDWFPRAAPFLFAAALMVPVLALVGFAQAGKEVAELVTLQGSAVTEPPPPILEWLREGAFWTFGGAVGAVFALRGLRALRQRSTLVRITYPDHQIVAIPRGFSVLEASRLANIPHLSICGGRGRCSTCRVRVMAGLANQPSPSPDESATLERVGAPPGVRLACQLRPTADLTVIPLLRTAALAPQPEGHRWTGEERFVAVLFCDLRGFTTLSERKLPFDVVYLLNQYFAMVGHAVERTGGRVDKFIGDGVMALFGIDSEPDDACRQALDAAAAIAEGVGLMNRTLRWEMGQSLHLAMGLHAGVAIVGEMGYGAATALTAVGDVVNVASRLEGLAKELDAELVVSDGVVQRAGAAPDAGEVRELAVRGREAPVRVLVLPRVATAALR